MRLSFGLHCGIIRLPPVHFLFTIDPKIKILKINPHNTLTVTRQSHWQTICWNGPIKVQRCSNAMHFKLMPLVNKLLVQTEYIFYSLFQCLHFINLKYGWTRACFAWCTLWFSIYPLLPALYTYNTVIHISIEIN